MLLCVVHSFLLLWSISLNEKQAWSIESTNDGDLQCFQIGSILKSATWNILEYAFDEHMYAFLLSVSQNRTAGLLGLCAF